MGFDQIRILPLKMLVFPIFYRLDWPWMVACLLFGARPNRWKEWFLARGLHPFSEGGNLEGVGSFLARLPTNHQIKKSKSFASQKAFKSKTTFGSTILDIVLDLHMFQVGNYWLVSSFPLHGPLWKLDWILNAHHFVCFFSSNSFESWWCGVALVCEEKTGSGRGEFEAGGALFGRH